MLISLKNVFEKAPSLKKLKKGGLRIEKTSMTIIIPTFNEEAKIEACLSSLLKSESPCNDWKILMIDDCSIDNTLAIARNIKERLDTSKNRLIIKSAGPRPVEERWVGKNWACYRAMKENNTSWVLFLDADVELKRQTLKFRFALVPHGVSCSVFLIPTLF